MTIYYLYVKIHRNTGLRYLGQTSKNPFIYKGSGVDWVPHIKQYGNFVDTLILLETSSKEERNYWGRYYSTLWNVVGSQDDFGNKIWANRIPETGAGESNGAKNKGKTPWNKGIKGIVKQSDDSNASRSAKLKGRPSPNRGKVGSANPFYNKKHSVESIAQIKEKKKNSIPWNKGLKGVQVPWNKGLKINDK